MAEDTNKIQHPKKAAFLAAFAKCGNVSGAARAAKIDRTMHYDWLSDDPDYSKAFADAKAEACDWLEEEARTRAEKGWLEPVFYKGEKIGSIRKKSDLLLIVLLKANMPDKYRDNVQHIFDPNQPLVVKRVSGVSMDDI